MQASNDPLPGDWPSDTIAVVLLRNNADEPWGLGALWRGTAAHNGEHDVGWNRGYESNLYALTGSGPGLPTLHEVWGPGPVAVWSSVGWRMPGFEEGEVVLWDDDDLREAGYERLDELPDIPLLEVERLLYCETCNEEQVSTGLCKHIWWCDTDGEWRGALYDAPPGPCERGCYGCGP